VKIDQSYIRQMDQDPRCATLVRGFVRMFQELGLRVVAEGIETVAQQQAMLDLGCVTGQGYLFGRPSPLHGPHWASLAKPG
jgi:EAL domain-containing protein (putative c-di-GMP-specific phosphodiesterase class I)